MVVVQGVKIFSEVQMEDFSVLIVFFNVVGVFVGGQ